MSYNNSEIQHKKNPLDKYVNAGQDIILLTKDYVNVNNVIANFTHSFHYSDKFG